MAMMLGPSDYAIAFVIASATCAALSLYAYHRRRVPGGYYFAMLMAAATEWALMSALENAVLDVPSKILFSKLSYLGIAAVAPLWLLFCLDYCQRYRLLRSRWKPLIWAVPVLVVALVFTNDWHGLIWPSVTPASATPGAILLYAHGPGVWTNVIYGYALMLTGSIFLLGLVVHSYKRFWVPVVAVILGAAAPWVANVMYMTGLNPLPGLDITPFAFTITGLLFAWAILGRRLFDLVPVAREVLIQLVADGALLVDDCGDVVEINRSARRILSVPDAAVEHDLGRAADRWPVLARCLQAGDDAVEEILIEGTGGAAWLEARSSIMRDNTGRLAGRLVILRDISRRKQAEEDLKASHEALKREMEEKEQAREELMLSLQEKEVLLREVHHRVKNNLQVISSLLSLQSANRYGDPTAALRESRDRIRSMALIHEKLYRSDDIAHIDFREYVEALTAGLQRSYFPGPGVRVSTEVEGVSLNIDLAISCGLIVKELVSNALKYAFPDGRSGEIHIGLVHAGRNYVLTVGDNGVGLPPGLDFRNTPSLGLQLVNMLVDQLEGTVELDSAGGTRFKITFAEIH
jgi:two-component sensor histidine kinase